MRPPSRVDMAMANPLPGAPSMSSLGTLQSSKDTVAVEEPLMPVSPSTRVCMAWSKADSLSSESAACTEEKEQSQQLTQFVFFLA